MVDTTPPGASCVISQLGTPLGIAEPTPAIAIVRLAEADIGVLCRRPGFQDAAVSVPPPTRRGIPGFVPNRRPDIDFNTRVEITMLPVPAGAAR